MEISISVPNLADGKTIIRPTIEYNRSTVFNHYTVYLEDHSVCPASELGPPAPSPASECAPPTGTK